MLDIRKPGHSKKVELFLGLNLQWELLSFSPGSRFFGTTESEGLNADDDHVDHDEAASDVP